jgi:tetratricopeptide (TPR) repeat protein
MEVKQRRFAAARKILQQGLKQYPADHSLLQAAGKVEERMGNHTSARELYSASLRVQPSAPTLVAYAMLEVRHPESGSLDVNRVSKIFEEALLLDSRHGPAYNAYARTIFQRTGDDQRARKIFERGVDANCLDAASIYHGFARLELALGNIESARELLIEGEKKVHRQDSAKDYVHRERALFLTHTLGMLELNRNYPADAFKVFSQGIERYGNSSQLLLGAALCEIMLGHEDSARSFFERSVLSDKNHAQAWQAWGVMEMRSGNINMARTLLDSGIKHASHHGALWQAYATMESRLGNIEAARALFQKGAKRAPNHVPLYQSWAVMELREENFDAAKRLIAHALTLDKRNGSGWLIVARIEQQQENHGLASLLLRRGLECCPMMPELYCELGDCLVKDRKINEARVIFEKGIEVDPHYAPLYHSLAELEARVFNVEALSRLNKRASSIFNSNAAFRPASKVWGDRIKAKRERRDTWDFAVLGGRIVDDVEMSDALPVNDDSNKFLASDFLEQGPAGRLLSLDDDIDEEALPRQPFHEN